jgi:hypothetical protein
MSPSTEPVNLVSVNTAPERAKRLIGILIKDVADKYNIVHAGNSDTIEGVKPLLLSIQPAPGILFCASMVSALDTALDEDKAYTLMSTSGHRNSRKRSSV